MKKAYALIALAESFLIVVMVLLTAYLFSGEPLIDYQILGGVVALTVAAVSFGWLSYVAVWCVKHPAEAEKTAAELK